MPVELEVIRAAEFVRLGANGRFDFEGTRAVLESLIMACRKRGVQRGLIDIRGATSNLAPHDLASLVSTLGMPGHSSGFRLAILHSDEQDYRAKLFAFFGALHGKRVGAFDSYEQAVEWLALEEAGEDEVPEDFAVAIQTENTVDASIPIEQGAPEQPEAERTRLSPRRDPA